MGEFSLIDVAVVTASKIVVERMLTPMVGNGTVVSGAAKGAIALGIGGLSKGSKYPKLIATGIAVDAAEDVLRGFNPFGLFGAASTETEDGVIRI
ncbi:MAG: hypothetical protein ACYS6W_14645 [Planctomycetota bacterium]